MKFFKSLVLSFIFCGAVGAVDWIELPNRMSGDTFAISRQFESEVQIEYPKVNFWIKVQYSKKDPSENYGVIQEWWTNCNELIGFIVTERIYKVKNFDLGTSTTLIHINRAIPKESVIEVCRYADK